MTADATKPEGNLADPLSSAVVEDFARAFPRFMDQTPDAAFESMGSSSLVCTLSDSGLECRVCGTSDGKTSTSTLGVLLCMTVFVAWTAVGKRRANKRRMAQHALNPLEDGKAED